MQGGLFAVRDCAAHRRFRMPGLLKKKGPKKKISAGSEIRHNPELVYLFAFQGA